MPRCLPPDLPFRLSRTERDLLDRVPLENRVAVLRRMLAALDPDDARDFLAALARRPDAATWLAGMRDVA